jgi:riboflavin kinase/FMN adenylyltransferase
MPGIGRRQNICYFGEVHVIHGVRHIQTPFSSSVLTIGNFDSLHLGHRALMQRVLERAHKCSIPSIVMTFDPHPVKVLKPDRHLTRIFDFEDQRQQLEALGVDTLVIEPFSREFSQLPPERYLQEWIYQPFRPETLVVGHDFSFGVGRQGTIEFLQNHARQLGFQVEVIPPVKLAGEVVSSSRIRKALQIDGDVQLAWQLMGRPFYLDGMVERGFGRGRTIGIPTANLRTAAETLPKRGVYCATALIRNQTYHTVVNIGLNPTFNEVRSHQPMSIEAHILDFNTDIYGENVKIVFVDRLRDERKFASVEELVAQIHSDILSGKKKLQDLSV